MAEPRNSVIPYGHQFLDDDDFEAVKRVLQSDWLTGGPAVEQFEQALCEQAGAAHTVACANGTAALHLACQAAGIGEGDEVIVPANSFVATANCVRYCGGRPVFADIDAATGNIAVAHVATLITERTKAIIPVDFAGQPCDYEALATLAQEHNVLIIEDACHALGAEYREKPVGGLPEVALTCFSFHPVKHITTGEGGAVTTNNAELARRLRRLRSHGITRQLGEVTQRNEAFSTTAVGDEIVNPWYYEMQELGFNYRITDIQCALGVSQLTKLQKFLARRREIASRYAAAWSGLDWLTLPLVHQERRSAWHLYVGRFDFDALGMRRAEVMGRLRRMGVGSQVHYIPIPLQPYYREYDPQAAETIPNCLAYYQRCLSLPMYPGMTETEIERVISAVKELG